MQRTEDETAKLLGVGLEPMRAMRGELLTAGRDWVTNKFGAVLYTAAGVERLFALLKLGPVPEEGVSKNVKKDACLIPHRNLIGTVAEMRIRRITVPNRNTVAAYLVDDPGKETQALKVRKGAKARLRFDMPVRAKLVAAGEWEMVS